MTSPRGYLDVVYDEDKKPLTDYPRRMTAHLTQRFEIARGADLLEIGCGRGEFLQGFIDAGARGFGVDLQTDAGKRAPGAEALLRCDLAREDLPFPAQTFDVVYSKSVIEHLREPDRMLSEAMRVLRPGGLLITMTPDWTTMYRMFFDDYTHVTPFTPVGLRDILLVNGFDDVTVERFRQLPILWGSLGPYLTPVSRLTRVATPGFLKPHLKWIRWSKEIMLLSAARKRAGARADDGRSSA